MHGSCPLEEVAVSHLPRPLKKGTRLTTHTLRRNLELLPEGEEYLRGRDIALAESRKLVAEHRLCDRVPSAVLVPVERNRDLDSRLAPGFLTVKVNAHVLARTELDLFLCHRRVRTPANVRKRTVTHGKVNDVEHIKVS
jgi:hypothetical protein